MGAVILNTSTKKRSHLNAIKNHSNNRLIINTIIPKFSYKNKNGDVVSPKRAIVY
jgi:hypothetical protein